MTASSPGSRLKHLAPLASVFALALALRIAWVALVEPRVELVDDAGYYDFFARSISEGRGYVRPEGTPTAFWPVGYPATLAGLYTLAGHSLLAAKLLNATLGALTAGLVFLLARRWFGTGQSTVAGILYACFPGAIGFASLTMSETLFTLLFVGALYLVARASEGQRRDFLWALGFGVIAGAAAYVRGQALALPVFAMAWLVFAGWGWRRAAGFGAVSLAIVLAMSIPWLVRNTRAFGEPTFLSTNMGINLWLGHNPDADGGPDYHLQLAFAGQFNDLPLIERESAWNREGFKEALRYITAHPLSEVRLSAQKVAKLYRDDSDAILWNEQNGNYPIFSQTARGRLEALFDGYYYAVGFAALIGLGLALYRRASWAGPAASSLFLWTLVHVIFYGEPRLHFPVLPLLAMAATVPLVELVSRRRARRATVPNLT